MMDGLRGGDAAPRMDGGREAAVGYVLAVSGVGLMTVIEDRLVEFEKRRGRTSRMGDGSGVRGKEARDVGKYVLGERTVFVCGISKRRFFGLSDAFFAVVVVASEALIDSICSGGVGGRDR